MLLAAVVSLVLDFEAPTIITDDLRTTWRAIVTNRASAPVENLDLRIAFSSATIVEVPELCTADTANVICIVDVPANGSVEIPVTTRTARRLGRFSAAASAPPAAPWFDAAVFGREFVVTNVADSGPGSLRQALLDINRACQPELHSDPCVVMFRIDGPVPHEGWFTIRPATPLPAITARDVVIDGGTQSRHTGETNPSGGPEILLDGSSTVEGHRLTSRGPHLRITDLVVGGFPGNGIDLEDFSVAELRRNYLGVDPTGLQPLPNGLRGLYVGQSRELIAGRVDVIRKVMSGNRRAGAFFWSGDPLRVFRNLVGVGADGVTPLGNGASGMFFHNPRSVKWPAETDENVIAYNQHAGIGVSLAASGQFAKNTFRDNGVGAIDVGLDGPSQAMRPFPASAGSSARP